MIEIYLDGKQLDVPQDISIGLSLGIADYADPCTASGAYTQTVEIPRTSHNNLAFAMAGEILSAEQFNHSEHRANIIQDGCELIGGKAYLEGVSTTVFLLQIVGEEIGWVEKIRDKKIAELECEAIGRYMPTEWSEFVGVQSEELPKLSWVLLQHGCWFQEADDEKIRRSWVTYQDLVPIVKLHTLLEHIFAGYKIEASSSLKELLHRTYSTMKWTVGEKASILAEDMDFEITSELKNADSESGELSVVIDENTTQATMALFDTIVEDKGKVLLKTDAGGIIKDTTIFFTPKTVDGSCFSLELKTQYQSSTNFNTTSVTDSYGTWDDVATSGTPMFADQLYQQGEDWPFAQFDVKDSVEYGSKKQLSKEDDYVSENQEDLNSADYYENPSNMPLCFMEVTNPGKYESAGYIYKYYHIKTSGVEGGAYETNIYRPTLLSVSAKQVVRANQAKGPNRPGVSRLIGIYPALRGKDGLIYVCNRQFDPHYEPYGDAEAVDVKVYSFSADKRLTFDVALQMPPQKFELGTTYPISQITFGSSNYGGEGAITVYGSAEGSLKPNYGWGVPIRESVKLSDVGGDTIAESMLRSIMQLYNLLIYTNPKTKTVTLYSFPDFWQKEQIVDWRERVDADSDISTQYVGDSIGKSIRLSYAEGSPRVDYYNARHELPYFAKKEALPNKMASEDKEVQNELFTPPYMVEINKEFGGGNGLIPAVAAKDKEDDVLEFNISDVPHTLVFVDNHDSSMLPLLPLNTAVFGDVGTIQPTLAATVGDATLSFADKDKTTGLHKYYDKQIALWKKAKRLTCYCRVEAWEIEALRYNSDNINFRSLFRLNINGEDIYGRLESIEYEPTNTTNKCTFIIE